MLVANRGPDAGELSCGDRLPSLALSMKVRVSAGVAACALAALTIGAGASARATAPVTASYCGNGRAAPATYQHVVVIVEENRRWAAVGGPGFTSMPYLHSVARSCAFFSKWDETNAHVGSLAQYIGLTSGIDKSVMHTNCSPSLKCRSTDSNIFRQVRVAGGTARSYVEGATSGCSPAGNAARHIPALYYFGADDRSFCQNEVRPLSELDANRLPTFAMITPNLSHDGHSSGNGVVDNWLSVHLAPILKGANYRSGNTAVFVLYDEDRPVPNLVIAPTARAGPISLAGAGHSAALRTFEQLLGLPTLPSVQGAVSLRSSAHL